MTPAYEQNVWQLAFTTNAIVPSGMTGDNLSAGAASQQGFVGRVNQACGTNNGCNATSASDPQFPGGATFTTNLNAEDLRQMSGGEGWDVVVNCAGGSKPVELAFKMARRGATLIMIGGSPDSQILSIPANRFVMGDLQVVGVCGYTTDSWARTLKLLETGEVRFNDLITHHVPLAEFAKAVNAEVVAGTTLRRRAVTLNSRSTWTSCASWSS